MTYEFNALYTDDSRAHIDCLPVVPLYIDDHVGLLIFPTQSRGLHCWVTQVSHLGNTWK